ncbi:MAG TPA: glycine cleavage system protein GcvH [Micromonosporaceae bacterium]|nr:glycine cleavage system protein GcvH [Micromonosporaceae bacterium]
MIPDDLHYTSDHEWVAAGSPARKVGITDYAQDALGDIVYVQLPDEGTAVEAGQAFGEIESTKSVSEIYAPISGTVSARNDRLADEPELINSDPYGDGWLVEITPTDDTDVTGLLDAEAYRALTSD